MDPCGFVCSHRNQTNPKMTNTPCWRASARRRLAICISVTPLVFQTNAESPPEITPASGQLPTIYVTARRIEEHPLDVPIYTQVITRDAIERSGTSNLIELLKSEANLNFISLSSASSTTVSLRGTGVGDNNGRTLITIDGIRMNRPDMGGVNWLQLPLQKIERIAGLQGPQGGCFGDNAVGGVIKINTRSTPEKSGGQINLLAGSFGTLKASGSYTFLGNNFWATLSGGEDHSDGYRERSAYTSHSGAIRFGYDNHRNSALQIGLSYVNSQYDQPSGLSSIAQFKANPRQSDVQYTDGWMKTTRLMASHQLGVRGESQILTDASYYSTEEFANIRSYPALFNRQMEGGSFSPKAVYKFDKGTVRFGIDANLDYLKVNAASAFPGRGNVDRDAIAPYLGGEFFLLPPLSLSAVGRHEFNEINAEGVNNGVPFSKTGRNEERNAYQVALNYRPTKATRFFIKQDHTYRFPGTDEIAYYQGFAGGGGVLAFDPSLKAERSDNSEIGADYQKGHWETGVSAYTMKTKGEIAFNNTTFLNENIAKTSRNGAQSHVRYDNGFCGFRARADFVDARVIEDPINHQSGQLQLTPKWHISETVFIRPIRGCTLSLTHRYKSAAPASPATAGKIPDATFFDVKLTYEITSSLSVYTGVNNIADRKSISAHYDDGFGTIRIYPDEGRFSYIGTSYKF